MDKKNTDIVELPMKERETSMLSKAIDFLKKSDNFQDIETFPIKMAVLENHVLGKVSEGTIYLSKDLFNEGQRNVVETLLEEYIHAKNEVNDRTREMQNVLIKFVVSTLEEKTGVYL
jgi:hypothetical protein